MILFMGVAGAGKSAQGRVLADELGLPWLSTGEFLRMLISGEPRKNMVSGKLLEDEEIIRLVQKIFTVINTDDEFILDGFPRTIGQADWLINQVKHGQLNITAVIHLTASPEVVKQRLLERGRQDDTAEAIAERFAEYDQGTVQILEQLKGAGIKVCEIDGNRSVSEVHDDILAAIEDVRQ
jgi:adenylate kinase